MSTQPPDTDIVGIGRLQSLQNQLLIELLKQNADASFTSDDNQSTSNVLNAAIAELNRVSRLVGDISIRLTRTRDAQLVTEMSRQAVHVFLGRLAAVRVELSSAWLNPPDSSSFGVLLESVRSNLVSLCQSLALDRDHVLAVNDEYVNRIARLKAERHHHQSHLVLLGDQMAALKAQISSLQSTAATANDQLDVLQLIMLDVGQLSDTATSLSALVSRTVQSVGSFQLATNAKLAMLVQESRETRGLLEREKHHSKQLCSLLESQQELLREATRQHRDELDGLRAELAAAKANQQTTPKKRRSSTTAETVVVAFTGLSKDREQQEQLVAILRSLGARVHNGADFTADITHVVAPTGYQSVRTMAAALSAKWLVSTGWITDSGRAGRLLSASGYGRQYHTSGLRGHTVHLTANFCKQQTGAQLNAACCRALIEPIGRGRVVDDVSTADYVLCGDEEDRHGPNWLHLADFIRTLIPGHQQ